MLLLDGDLCVTRCDQLVPGCDQHCRGQLLVKQKRKIELNYDDDDGASAGGGARISAPVLIINQNS